MKFIKVISVVLSICSLNLSYACDDRIEPKYIRISSAGVNEKKVEREDGWHIAQAEKLTAVYKKLQELDPGSQRNGATFYIRIMRGREILGIQDSNNTFFVSGGNTEFLLVVGIQSYWDD